MKNELKFRIGYDPLVKAVYIKLSEGKVAKTIEFAPETFVDLDQKGKLLGVEMINPGKLIITRKKHPPLLQQIAKKYHVPELKEFPQMVENLVKV